MKISRLSILGDLSKEANFKIYVFRCSLQHQANLLKKEDLPKEEDTQKKDNLLHSVEELTKNSKAYQRKSKREEAPSVTDCLTSVWYVFKKALKVDMDITLIGDMPRRLLLLSEWNLLCIDRKDAECGDVIFVKNRDNERLISHVGIILGADRVFHCCSKIGKASIQSDKEFFTEYHQQMKINNGISPGIQMVRNIDQRNIPLREAQKGECMLTV